MLVSIGPIRTHCYRTNEPAALITTLVIYTSWTDLHFCLMLTDVETQSIGLVLLSLSRTSSFYERVTCARSTTAIICQAYLVARPHFSFVSILLGSLSPWASRITITQCIGLATYAQIRCWACIVSLAGPASFTYTPYIALQRFAWSFSAHNHMYGVHHLYCCLVPVACSCHSANGGKLSGVSSHPVTSDMCTLDMYMSCWIHQCMCACCGEGPCPP